MLKAKKKNVCNDTIGRTDCGLAELLVGDLVGNVGPHQHTHGDTQLVHDHVRDEFETIGVLLNALETHTHRHTRCCKFPLILSPGCFERIKRSKDKINKTELKRFYLYEGDSHSVTLYLALHGFTHFAYKLVWNHKHQNVCVAGSVHQVWDSELRRTKNKYKKKPQHDQLLHKAIKTNCSCTPNLANVTIHIYGKCVCVCIYHLVSRL